MNIQSKVCKFSSALHWPTVWSLGVTFPSWGGKLCEQVRLSASGMIGTVKHLCNQWTDLKKNNLKFCRDLVLHDGSLHWASGSATSSLLQAQEDTGLQGAAATKVEGSAAPLWGDGGRRWGWLLLNLTLPLPNPFSSALLCSGRAGWALSFLKWQLLASPVVLRSPDSALAEASLVWHLPAPSTHAYLLCMSALSID